ncbi:MAG: class I SAM-dependent methyltransferase [Gemmataceae bacterium]
MAAPTYDFLNHFLSLNIDKWWRRKTTQMVLPCWDDPILDLLAQAPAISSWRTIERPRERRHRRRADFRYEMLQIAQKVPPIR